VKDVVLNIKGSSMLVRLFYRLLVVYYSFIWIFRQNLGNHVIYKNKKYVMVQCLDIEL